MFKTKQLIVLLLIVTVVACKRQRDSHEYSQYMVIGDSVAFGTGANDPQSTITSCLTRLTGQEFQNLAIPGSTSRNWVGRVAELISSKPKLVFVSVGGNDLYANMNAKLRDRNPFTESFPLSETLRNMRAIFSSLVDVDVIYLGIHPPLTLRRPQTFLLDNRLSRVQDEVAPQSGALVVRDAYDGMWLNSNLMFDDLHPNDRGYAILCDRIRQAMQSNPRFAQYLR